MSAVDEVSWTRLPDAILHGESLGLYAAGDPGQPAVLLLHGIEDSWSSWQSVAQWLVPQFRCYAVDLPWRAGGDYRWRGRSSEQWVADALAAVPERPTVVIAHSFSANALIQALSAGSMLGAASDDGAGSSTSLDFGAMVLISPFYRPPTVPVNWNTFDHSLADFRTTMTAGLRIRLGKRAARLDPEVFELMAATMLDGIGVLGFLAVFEQFAAASELDLSARPAPALVIAGSRDPGIAGERAEWLNRAIPHATMQVDPDYSHFCHLEQPELIGPLVAEFLRTATLPPEKGPSPMPTLGGSSSTYTGRPRYEGANISTFIGFKNFTALAEDAVLQHFRELGLGPQRLFEQYGLGLTVVHSSVSLTGTMQSDDLIVGSVTAIAAKPGQGAAFDVRLAARRGEEDVRVLNGKVRVQLVSEKDGNPAEPVPADLAAFVVAEVSTPGAAETATVTGTAQLAAALAERSGNDFAWSWKIPYFACHYYTRIQHSAYVKLLEEAVDRYLDHAGLPITGLLAQRDWIPVVSRARIDLHADAYMGETLLITFAVDDVIKDTVYTARMECRVLRGDQLVHIASATIMHGYVIARGPKAFQELVQIDATTRSALLGGAA